MTTMRSLIGNKLLGVAFIGLFVLGLWLVYAIFTQKFADFAEVRLSTSTVGLQLPDRADVKVRGVLVGQVLDRSAEGDGATLTIGIEPDKIDQIPANVTAALLPKTLFGEKFVALQIPDDAASTALSSGDAITQTKMPIEVERVLNDLYPLLRTVQPAELSYTLNAIANALEGRGEELGGAVVTLDSYLKRFNPQLPALIDDLRQLSTVSTTYADVLPDLAQTLRNTVKTGNTLVDKEQGLNDFLREVSAFSGTTKGFLDDNGDNLTRLGKLSRPQVQLLERYSPEFPCLLDGIVGQVPQLASTFRGFIFHINLEVLPKQPRGYNTNDTQVYGADNGPNCAGLPNPPGDQATPFGSANSPIKAPNFRDGVDDFGGSLNRGDNQRTAPGFGRISVHSGGTAFQQALIRSLTAPALGVPADEVPGVTTLLFGPLAAGTQVSAR